MNGKSTLERLVGISSWTMLFAGLILLGYCYWSQRESPELVASRLETVGLSSDVRRALDLDSSHALGQIPIERIQVGMRVPARNPEITNDERSGWVEPEWDRWVKLSLDMPKPDGSVLRMELLRSEDWVFSQVGFVVAEKMGNSNDESGRDEAASKDSRSETLARQMSILSFEAAVELGRQIYGDDFQTEQISLSPLRPIFRELASTSSIVQHAGDTLGYELLGLAVQMDLPELGLTGEAIVESIEPFSAVSAGPGQVVTATFHHGSADTIDLSIAGDSRGTGNVETIGTTSNHPFWSQDRQEFIEAGSLALGERLVTHQGEAKRVVNKLPRPGPEPVFNIEVWGEHVYYAGRSAALVHNTYPNDPSRGAALRAKYGDLSPAQRQARITELSEANYARRIQDFEAAHGTPNVHSFADHGAQTTLGQQVHRVHTGVAPSGRVSSYAPRTATRFLSQHDHFHLMTQAHRQQMSAIRSGTLNLRPNGTSFQNVGLNGRVIGNGARRIGSQANPTGTGFVTGNEAIFNFEATNPTKFFTGFVQP
jgi:hypothetical protein